MKTIQIFFLLLTLLCVSSLSAHTCLADETEPAQITKTPEKENQTKPLNSPKKQDKTANTNAFITQNQEKQSVQNTADRKSFSASDEPIPSFGLGNYFQGIGLMLLLLFVFWYILKLMRKYGNGRFLPNQKLLPRDSMYLEGQLPLGQGKSILIVKVLDERLVLGVTEKNINLLSKTGTNHAETFEELMQQVPFKNTPDA